MNTKMGTCTRYRPQLAHEVAVPVHLADRIIEAIGRAARTDQPGDDGKIFVSQLKYVLSINTGLERVPPLAA